MGLWGNTFISVFVLNLILTGDGEGAQLSDWVSSYRSLHYDTADVHRQHHRHRRDVDQPPVVVSLEWEGRQFRLVLRRDSDTISPNAVVEQPFSVPQPFSADHLVHGTLADDPGARVWGSLREGVFEGVIDSSRHGGRYYVERAHKYGLTGPGHSVIYHEDSVRDPYGDKRGSTCAHTDALAERMRAVQESAEDALTEEDALGEEEEEEETPPHEQSLPYHHMYSQWANRRKGGRVKRSIGSGGVGEDNRGTCTLSIQTDPLLWRYIYAQEKNDSIKTRDEITAMVSQHIKAVNHIYGDVVFHGKYKHKGIRFEVQRIKIDDDSTCSYQFGARKAEMNKFCKENVDVSYFLNLHSQTNHDDFCLSYVFTFRDFTGGTLGLAWVASPSGASGGICEKYKTYTENLAGSRHTEQRSLNTGIITFLNYNSRVPPKVSQLTLAHEIGHNFGSPHDFPASCKPGGREGNFIMFSSATSGDRHNNNKFSSCSVRNISQVLDAIADNRRKNCFKATNGTFCGNKIVEEGEECDCGYDEHDCEESCCYPRLLSAADRRQNSSAASCSRRANTQCSPSEGPCCDVRTCGYARRTECHSQTDCTHSAMCNGRMARCPPPRWQRNFKPCNQDTKVCLDGECRGSICLAHNMSECFLTEDVVKDKKKLCEIACQKGNNATCQSTSELSHIFPQPVFMRPSAPCNNFQGYCDVFQKCRAVDAEGPLARLKNYLLDPTTISVVTDWVVLNWYWVVFLCVAFVLVMGVFIKCCAIHTPSSNPRKPHAIALSETFRHPVHTLRRAGKRHGPRPDAMQLQPQRSAAAQGRSQGRSSRAATSADPPRLPPPPSHNNRRQNRANRNPPPTAVVALPPPADDPPPPYPGPPPSAPAAPSTSVIPPPTRRGYGEGRGHYNRPKGGATKSPGKGKKDGK